MAILTFKYPTGADAWKKMELDNSHKLPKVMEFLLRIRQTGPLSFLNDRTLMICTVTRQFDPSKCKYTYESLAQHFNTTLEVISDKFFRRENGPTKHLISEGEYLYKEKIMVADNPFTVDEKGNRVFIEYSAHTKLPGKDYSAAIDLRTDGTFSDSEINIITRELNMEFNKSSNAPDIFVLYHSLPSNASHIHIEDKKLFKANEAGIISMVNSVCLYDKLKKEYHG